MLERLRGLLAALWGGQLLCLALLAAPSAFAVLERSQAGLLVGRVFAQDAYASLVLALLLMLVERRIAREEQGQIFSAAMLLPAAALFCTLAGYFALQPMLDAARAGQGALSFMTLHLLSMVFFILKTLFVLALAWRCSKN
jgi:hypothetical protein